MFWFSDQRSLWSVENKPVFTNLAMSEPFEIISDLNTEAMRVHLFVRPLPQLPESTAIVTILKDNVESIEHIEELIVSA